MHSKTRVLSHWHLNRRSGTNLSGLASYINAQVRGWINYGAFYRSELYSPGYARQRASRSMGDAVAHWHMLPRTNNRPVGAG